MTARPKSPPSLVSPSGQTLVSSACSALVFRVQDRDGRGPWKPGFSEKWIDDSRTDAEYEALKPGPLEFGDVARQAIYGMHLGYGCESLEQLRRWFTEQEYRTLRRHGYRAVKIEVGRILASSELQCVFERSKPLRKGVKRVNLYPQNAKADPLAGSEPTKTL